ncbi:SsrA-binding protein [Candidatus Tremblaya princeps]|uniref:SsrA-binding protein n=1 Tax=Tremblaya princeps TaxID=189385 RepID=A0A143WNG8_TREPR|nr:SsrA-binding protein [Candidatus Tremblaya princeps]
MPPHSGSAKMSCGMVLAENRKACVHLDVARRYEAGLVLHGWEARSIRSSSASLLGASVRVSDGLPVLVGVGISYPTGTHSVRSRRPIPLLLHRSEALRMAGCLRCCGYAAVPSALYDRGGYIKCEVLVGRRRGVRSKTEPLSLRVRAQLALPLLYQATYGRRTA